MGAAEGAIEGAAVCAVGAIEGAWGGNDRDRKRCRRLNRGAGRQRYSTSPPCPYIRTWVGVIVGAAVGLALGVVVGDALELVGACRDNE